MIVLPEMFTTPFNKEYMLAHKEPITHNFISNPQCVTSRMLSEMAKRTQKYIVGGSIPEEVEGNDRIFNTCLCMNRSGEIVTKHRKLHLFDINIPGGITSIESNQVIPGPP